MRRVLGVSLTCALLCLSVPVLSCQAAQLRVLSSAPTGELNQISESTEIRVIFSEPMVALGKVPSNPTPDWIHISPAMKGLFRWSGTTVLVFTPDPTTRLPYSS